MAEENGLVQIYYGDGKGKTTAAFGLAFRCAGWGRRVVIAQFLKSSPCGELTAAERFPTLTVLRSKGIHKFTFQMNDEEKAVVAENCRTLLRQAAELARAEEARLLVLDEVIDALRGFLPQEELCAFLDERPAGLEVVLTGHSLPEALERRARLHHPHGQREAPLRPGRNRPQGNRILTRQTPRSSLPGAAFYYAQKRCLPMVLMRGRLQIHALVAVSGLK